MNFNKLLFTFFLLFVVGCGATTSETSPDAQNVSPVLDPIQLDGRKLNVVATTSIIGDVVSQVGGDDIQLTTLIGRNQDSHSYEATPSDLVALEQADIIFVNGWGLEEQLSETISENFADKFVSISTGIEPLDSADDDDHDGEDHHEEEGEHEGEDHHEEEGDHEDEDHHEEEGEHEGEDHHDEEGHHDEHAHGAEDPHVWFSVPNVESWTAYAVTVLSKLDPENANGFTERGEAYSAELTTLHEEIIDQLASLPADQRKIVTNHDAFAYLADTYKLEIIGTVIPATSTSAEPSPKELVNLIQTMQAQNVCTVFAETSQTTALADTVAGELKDCPAVDVLQLYTGSVGDGDASSYTGMMRSNVETIVNALQP